MNEPEQKHEPTDKYEDRSFLKGKLKWTVTRTAQSPCSRREACSLTLLHPRFLSWKSKRDKKREGGLENELVRERDRHAGR